MYAGVGTCGHDVQFRTPPVLELAPAEDTVSQVNQVTNVLWVIGSFLVRLLSSLRCSFLEMFQRPGV